MKQPRQLESVGMPLVEIAGEHRVLIENHKGVTLYCPEQVSVRVKFGQICICGKSLTIAQMRAGSVVVCGRIDSVTLLRGRGI